MVREYFLKFKLIDPPSDLSVYVNGILVKADDNICTVHCEENRATVRFLTKGKTTVRFRFPPPNNKKFFIPTFPAFTVNQNYIDTVFELELYSNSYLVFCFGSDTFLNIDRLEDTVYLACVKKQKNVRIINRKIFSKRKLISDYLILLAVFIPYAAILVASIINDIFSFDVYTVIRDDGLTYPVMSGKEGLIIAIPWIIVFIVFSFVFPYKTKKYHQKYNNIQ